MHVLRLVTDWSRRPSLTNGEDIVSFKFRSLEKKLLQQKKNIQCNRGRLHIPVPCLE